MRTYLLENRDYKIEGELDGFLKKLGHAVEVIELPESHKLIPELFKEKEPGAVFIPTNWHDLFCVKVIHEIYLIKTLFETVMVGPPPENPQLIVAFNGGLSAFLETPYNLDRVEQIMSRVSARHKVKMRQELLSLRLAEYEEGGLPVGLSPQMQERDIYIAKAFMDVYGNKGPIFSGNCKILLLASSGAQEKRLEKFLTDLGILVDSVDNMKDAIALSKDGNYKVIISDSLLKDGDVSEFVRRLSGEMVSNMPRVLVWSSSPDKIRSLLTPESHIDDVILKPDPGSGMEMVLPSILAAIYSVDA